MRNTKKEVGPLTPPADKVCRPARPCGEITESTIHLGRLIRSSHVLALFLFSIHMAYPELVISPRISGKRRQDAGINNGCAASFVRPAGFRPRQRVVSSRLLSHLHVHLSRNQSLHHIVSRLVERRSFHFGRISSCNSIDVCQVRMNRHCATTQYRRS